MAIIGPGSVREEEVRPSPTLEGASQFEVVRILNPLSDDFAVQVAQSVPVSLPYSVKNVEGGDNLSESDITKTYGVSLRGPDHSKVSKKHILNKTIIKSGQSLNFRGDVAQVAVRQLVSEIMQQRGLTKFLADPTQRKMVEEEIIIARGTMEDLMNNNLKSVTEQIDTAIEKANEQEESFPGLIGQTGQGNGISDQDLSTVDQTTDTEGKRRGRPPKQ